MKEHQITNNPTPQTQPKTKTRPKPSPKHPQPQTCPPKPSEPERLGELPEPKENYQALMKYQKPK